MTEAPALAVDADDRRIWGTAGAIAFGVHAVAVAALFLVVRQAEPPVPEPVVLIDMPPLASASSETAEVLSQPQSVTQPVPVPAPPIDAPLVKAPLPVDPVVLPVAQPMRPVQSAAPPVVPAVATPITSAASATSPVAGNDPRARKQEADYFALLAAHLNRKKSYPVEAKKARQEGIVTVRFTVGRDGNVSALAIKRGSGHDILDRATLDLVQRVAPMPRMPASMQRDSLTLALPIEYSLKTN